MSVPKAITASATRAADMPKATGSTRAPQWQLDSLAYYDQIGAVRYAAQFTARALSKIRWFPATRDPDTGEVTESEDPTLTALFDRFQDPGGGRAVMTSTYGQLDFLMGEMYLLWTQADPEEEDPEEAWEIVSTLELRKQGKRLGQEMWHRIQAPGLTPQELLEAEDEDFEPLGDNVRVFRWWRQHPAYSMMADSPMRSVLAECEEIVRATHTINARLISRLAGPGIFAYPQSWQLIPLQGTVGQENPEEDPFGARLAKAMITAIGKPGSAESVAPITVKVPDGTTDQGHLYKFWDPAEVIREIDLREKAMQRFAVGVDMPPEKVMGLSTSGTQHWNAWMVDEDSWGHVAPVAQAFADNVASSYLRPAAKDENFGDWQLVCVGYDPAEVLVNPDGFADAKELHDRLVVSDEYLRNAGNATDEDAIDDDEEMARRLFMLTRQEVEVEGGAIVIPEPAVTPIPPEVPAPDPNAPPSPNGNGGPPTGEDTPRQAPVAPDGLTASSYRLLGAAEASLETVRELIGKRLIAHLSGRCPECVENARTVRSGLVAATLGPEIVLEHGPGDLVPLALDGCGAFVQTAIKMGVSHTQARALAEVLELHAITTIYEVNPELPAGFVGRVRALSGAAV